MPYVTKSEREKFDSALDQLTSTFHNYGITQGQLNYLITSILLIYARQTSKRYSVINDVMGVLACVQAEFYRREAIPYEEEKKELNGDVWY